MRHLIYDRSGRRVSYARGLTPKAILGNALKVWIRLDFATVSSNQVVALNDTVGGTVITADGTGAAYEASQAIFRGNPCMLWSAGHTYGVTTGGPTLVQPWSWGMVFANTTNGYGFGCLKTGSGYPCYITTFADWSESIYTRHPDTSDLAGTTAAGTSAASVPIWCELCSAGPSGRHNSTVASAARTGTPQDLAVLPNTFDFETTANVRLAELIGVSGPSDLSALAPYLMQRYGIRR